MIEQACNEVSLEIPRVRKDSAAKSADPSLKEQEEVLVPKLIPTQPVRPKEDPYQNSAAPEDQTEGIPSFNSASCDVRENSLSQNQGSLQPAAFMAVSLNVAAEGPATLANDSFTSVREPGAIDFEDDSIAADPQPCPGEGKKSSETVNSSALVKVATVDHLTETASCDYALSSPELYISPSSDGTQIRDLRFETLDPASKESIGSSQHSGAAAALPAPMSRSPGATELVVALSANASECEEIINSSIDNMIIVQPSVISTLHPQGPAGQVPLEVTDILSNSSHVDLPGKCVIGAASSPSQEDLPLWMEDAQLKSHSLLTEPRSNWDPAISGSLVELPKARNGRANISPSRVLTKDIIPSGYQEAPNVDETMNLRDHSLEAPPESIQDSLASGTCLSLMSLLGLSSNVQVVAAFQDGPENGRGMHSSETMIRLKPYRPMSAKTSRSGYLTASKLYNEIPEDSHAAASALSTAQQFQPPGEYVFV